MQRRASWRVVAAAPVCLTALLATSSGSVSAHKVVCKDTVVLHPQSAYQAVQVSWVSDPGQTATGSRPGYPATSDMEFLGVDDDGDLRWTQTLPLVENKRTLLFNFPAAASTEADYAGRNAPISFPARNFFTEAKEVRIRLSLQPSGRVLYTSPSVTIPAGSANPPPDPCVGLPGEGTINVPPPVPDQPFRPTTSETSIRADLIAADGGAVHDKMTVLVGVKKAHRLNALFVPVVFKKDLIANTVVSGHTVTAWTNWRTGLLHDVYYEKDDAVDFFRDTYPVADDSLNVGSSAFFGAHPRMVIDAIEFQDNAGTTHRVTTFAEAAAFPSPTKSYILWHIIADPATKTGFNPNWLKVYDRVVLMVPRSMMSDNELGVANPRSNKGVVFIAWEPTLDPPDFPGMLVAHEIGHTFGLGEEYKPLLLGGYAYTHFDSYGYRVAKKADKHLFPSTMGVYKQHTWMTKPAYVSLLEKFTASKLDPDVIVVTGVLSDDGTFKPSSSWPVFEGFPDYDAGDAGTHRIEALDSSGAVLASTPFSPEFRVHLDFRGEVDTDRIPVVVKALFPEGTARIRLVEDDTDSVVHARTVSENPPTVDVVYPTEGAVVGVPWTAAWTASDPDGDPLRYTVELSNDGGDTWQTVAVNVAGRSLRVDDTAGLTQGLYALRVVASDGVNEAAATSSAFHFVTDDAVEVDARVSIRYLRARRQFAGRVKSAVLQCKAGRTVVVKKRKPGRDRVLARVVTNEDGRWRAGRRLRPGDRGRFYATARKGWAVDEGGSGYLCRAARSRAVAAG